MALLDLGGSLCLLAAHKYGWLTLSQESFLLFVNINMIFTALVAVTATAAALQRRVWSDDRKVGWLLLVAMTCLLLSEILAGAEEAVTELEQYRALTVLPLLASRLALAWLALHALTQPRAGAERSGHLGLVISVVLAGGLAAWGTAGVLVPLWGRQGPSAEVAAAAADLLALLLATPALVRGAGRLSHAYWLPLAGMVMYLLTDLYYYQHAARGAADFCLAELGFFCGYWIVAVGLHGPRSIAEAA